MTTAGQALEADHRTVDDHFAAFADAAASGTWERDPLEEAVRALRRHIWVEEDLFFPPLRAAGVVGPVMVMLREHGQIWRFLDELEALAQSHEPDLQGALAIWGALEQVLQQHNVKEEQILYATADRVLDADTTSGVIDGLTTDVPAGWRCAMAAR